MDSWKRPPEALRSQARVLRLTLRVKVPAALRTLSPKPPRALGLRPGPLSSLGPGAPLKARPACSPEGAPKT